MQDAAKFSTGLVHGNLAAAIVSHQQDYYATLKYDDSSPDLQADYKEYKQNIDEKQRQISADHQKLVDKLPENAKNAVNQLDQIFNDQNLTEAAAETKANALIQRLPDAVKTSLYTVYPHLDPNHPDS